MLKNILDVCGAAIGFYTIGYALAFGDKEGETGFTFAGTTGFFAATDNMTLLFGSMSFALLLQRLQVSGSTMPVSLQRSWYHFALLTSVSHLRRSCGGNCRRALPHACLHFL